MQELLFSDLNTDLRAMQRRLVAAFGHIRDERRLDPTGQFVRTFIGSRTQDEVSMRAFRDLLLRYRYWSAIAEAPAEEIETVLSGVTFAPDKARNLKTALRRIRAGLGRINLEFLADHPVSFGLFWLEQFHGVRRKIAAATLNFSTLRGRAFVVDTHVRRVLRRFGFVGPRADTIAAYHAIMAAGHDLDADDLYELHWHLKRLGQHTCTHFHAACDVCPLSDLCLKRVSAV